LSHELDYVLWTAGPVEACTGFSGKLSDLAVDADDVAEIVLRHAGGTISSVHMDMVDRCHRRAARWIGTHGTIEWEAGGPVRLVAVDGDERLWNDSAFDLDDTYEAEIERFVDGRPFPGDARADAVRVLEIVTALRAG
jgi:predicted dehydrogenase